MVREAPAKEDKKQSLLERIRLLLSHPAPQTAGKKGADLAQWLTEREELFNVCWRVATHAGLYLRKVFEVPVCDTDKAQPSPSSGLRLTGSLETYAAGHFGVVIRDVGAGQSKVREHHLLEGEVAQEGPISTILLRANETGFGYTPLRNLEENAATPEAHQIAITPMPIFGMQAIMEGLCILFQRLYNI